MITDLQADALLRINQRRQWDYGEVYDKFYTFMESLPEDERELTIGALLALGKVVP